MIHISKTKSDLNLLLHKTKEINFYQHFKNEIKKACFSFGLCMLVDIFLCVLNCVKLSCMM